MVSNKKLLKKPVLLGAHMSILGGFHKAIERGVSIGCNSIQIFTHSNRQWNIKDITEEQIYQFQKTKKELGIEDKNIIVHSSYLVNLASTNPETEKKSIETLIKELTQCAQLDIQYLVIHTGSGFKDNAKRSLDQIIKNINLVLDNSKNNKTIILLENMAGQGSSIGSSLEELSYILKNINTPSRVGICFDTCHAWAAGYDFSEKTKYYNFWEEFDKEIGIKKLKFIHLNDSKTKLNSRVDRHAKINQGAIGLEAFKLIINDPNLENIPKILEVPVDDYKEYGLEIEKLKNLIND